MKTIFTFLILAGLVAFPAVAQKKVEKTTPWTKGKTIYLNLKFASDIVIKTWQKNEVLVSANVVINNNADNNEFVLTSSESDSEIQIKSDIPRLKEIAKAQTTVGKQHTYYGNGGYWDDDKKVYINTGKQVTADLDYEVFVPEGADVRLKTIDGNIKFVYTGRKYDIESISGKIDISISEKQACTLTLKTITGDIYSNLPLQLPADREKDELNLVGGGKFNQNIEAKLNGGGTEVHLKTISSNIFLRKTP
jgi:hypothetical protein